MGTIRRIAAGIVLVLVLGAVSVAGLYAAGVIQQPTVTSTDVGDWGNVTEERTEIVTTIGVHNPNPVGLAYGGVRADYTLFLNDVAVANGSKSGVNVQPGNNSVQVRTYVQNEALPEWWVEYVRANETITTRVDGDVTVSLGPLSTSVDLPAFERTLQRDGAPIRAALTGAASSMEGDYTVTQTVSEGPIETDVTAGYVVERGWATWGDVGANETTVLFHYRVHNPSEVIAVPAAPDGLAATVEANGVALMDAQGDEFSLRNVGEDATIDPGETREVVLAVAMDNRKIDDWFRSHVRNEERTRVETEFRMTFDVQGTTLEVPQGGGATYSCTFQTGILVDDQTGQTDCGELAP